MDIKAFMDKFISQSSYCRIAFYKIQLIYLHVG